MTAKHSRRVLRPVPWLSAALLLSLLTAVACASTAASAVEHQLARGRLIYEQGCATENCHGVNGEGIRRGESFRAWPLVGEDFQRRNPTAQVVFDVVRSGGESSLRALTDQQVYDSIAYELSLNGVDLAEPLDSGSAPDTPSGQAAESPEPGTLFPPPGNAQLLSNWDAPPVPLQAENDRLRLRLTQIARADSVGARAAPAGTGYVFIVFTLEALGGDALEVRPEDLPLETADGRRLEPQDLALAYPVDRFHPQTIQPDHGTAALAIFAVPEAQEIARLIYALPGEAELELVLRP